MVTEDRLDHMTETGPGGDSLKRHPTRNGLLSDCRIDTHDIQKPGEGQDWRFIDSLVCSQSLIRPLAGGVRKRWEWVCLSIPEHSDGHFTGVSPSLYSWK